MPGWNDARQGLIHQPTMNYRMNVKKINIKYIIQSKTHIKTIVKEPFLHLPFFQCKITWKIIFMYRKKVFIENDVLD